MGSQATLALTLALLAFCDRRTKGMPWLACAAVLQMAVSVSLLPASPPQGMTGSAVDLLILLQYCCFYLGLRWFAVRRSLRSRSVPFALGLSAAVAVGVERRQPDAGLMMMEFLLLGVIGVTVHMLWSSRLPAMQVALRCCAVLLGVRGVFIAAQMVSLAEPSPTAAHWHEWLRLAILTEMPVLLLSYLGLFAAESKRRLHEETRLDILTGLWNRRALEETAARQARHCALNDIPLALLMMDLDHFKQLNDTWGHGVGDRALCTMGSVLPRVAGEGATTARVGGEEFAMLLPGCELERARQIAEQVRTAVEELRLSEGDSAARFTVSVGVSTLHPSERTWTDMMRRADDALYQAKREGRNRVIVCAAANLLAQGPVPRQASWKKYLLLPRQGRML